jgi:glycosyltransferase involved in cell wall biosynthesis
MSKSEHIVSKKVLIIAYAFPPHSVVGAMRPMRFCKYLPKISDWQPIVLSVKKAFERNDPDLLKEFSAGVPVYRAPIIEPKLWYEKRRAASGKALPKTALKSQFNSFVQADPAAQSFWKQFKRLAAELMSPPDPQLFWTVPVVLQALKIIKRHEVKTFVITSPPWSTQIAGYFIKKLSGLPWVADLRDPWTDVPRYDRFALTQKFDAFLEKKCLTHADRVVSTSETFSDQLRRKYPDCREDRFATLYNGFDEEKFRLPAPLPSDAFTLVHLGTFYPLFDSFFILNAIGHWLANDPTADENRIRLIFIGQIDEALHDVLEASGLLGITEITGFKPHREAIGIAAGADALLLSIGLSPATPRGWLPSKIFEYLALNRPIIASVLPGEAAHLIRRARSGFVIDSRDQKRVSEILHRLYHRKMTGGASRLEWQNDEAVVDELKQAHLIRHLAGMLDDITAAARQQPSR